MGKIFSKNFIPCTKVENSNDSLVESMQKFFSSIGTKKSVKKSFNQKAPQRSNSIQSILKESKIQRVLQRLTSRIHFKTKIKQGSLSSDDLYHPIVTDFDPKSDKVQVDDKGYLVVRPGDILKLRCRKSNVEKNFEVRKTLGKGAYGQVLEVKDSYDNRKIALKIINIFNCDMNIYSYNYQDEINVLETIKEKDTDGKNHCVSILDSFDYHGHICIAFEIFGSSVEDFMLYNHYDPFHITQVRHIIYQLCTAVKFLHENDIIHTDLKLNNILFENSKYDLKYNSKKERDERLVKNTNIKLIDFGSAVFGCRDRSSLVQTRNYRAPEVILGLPWSKPCDVWSIGCILFELYSGFTLFPNFNNNNDTNLSEFASDIGHLALMERIFGQIPETMVNHLPYFDNGKMDPHLSHSLVTSACKKDVNVICKPLREFMISNEEEHLQLFDLIEKMLVYDPKKRITLEKALQHEFFNLVPNWQRHKGNDIKVVTYEDWVQKLKSQGTIFEFDSTEENTY